MFQHSTCCISGVWFALPFHHHLNLWSTYALGWLQRNNISSHTSSHVSHLCCSYNTGIGGRVFNGIIICCFQVVYPHLIKSQNRFGFAHIGRVGSVFATLMVTIERFVAVWCPLQRLKSTKTLLSISIIGSLIYNIPRFLEFESTTVYVNRYHFSHQPPSQPLPIINHSYIDDVKLSKYESNNSDNVIKVN